METDRQAQTKARLQEARAVPQEEEQAIRSRPSSTSLPTEEEVERKNSIEHSSREEEVELDRAQGVALE